MAQSQHCPEPRKRPRWSGGRATAIIDFGVHNHNGTAGARRSMVCPSGRKRHVSCVHVVKDAGSDKGSDSEVADPGCKVRRSAIRGLSVPMVADDDAV
jgi:hypothetical protein